MESIDSAILEHLRPFFYIIGLLVVSQAGGLIKMFLDRSKKKEDKISEQLKDLTVGLVRVETKLDLIADQHQKDINGLGKKIRDFNV